MNVDEYQRWTRTTAQHNDPPTELGADLLYLGCGLAGEAGEVANQIKKVHRDDAGVLSKERRNKIRDEAGDTLWYLMRVLDGCGITVEEVVNCNVAKLQARLDSNTIKGDRRAPEPLDLSKFISCPGECGRSCPAGLVCCPECDPGSEKMGDHTNNCDSRQFWFEKYRDEARGSSVSIVAMTDSTDPTLPPPPSAAGPNAKQSANSFAGGPGEGGGERRSSDQGNVLKFITEEEFVEAIAIEES